MLPQAQTHALNALLDGVSRKDLALRVEKLSRAYRAGGTSLEIREPLDALAYAVTRAPATYAGARAVLGRLKVAMPDFAPASLLDVGAGPGSASWAAAELWPGLSVAMLDRNPQFRALAARLMAGAQVAAGEVHAPKPKAELAVANYVLAEFPQSQAGAIARALWQAAEQVLVLVEPGTPQGFGRIRAARAALIAAGAHVAAPCTHDKACPLTDPDWCHFVQRVQRSRDHKLAKGADAPFEDERYSYVVVTRVAVAKGARIIKPVVETKPGLTLPLCDGEGLRNQFVARRDKEAFRRARKLEWGDSY